MGIIAAFAEIDRVFVSRGRQPAAVGDVRILAMPDHPTPIEIKTHVAEPVPFVLWGPGVASNGADRYDEATAEATGLHLDPGRQVMDQLLAE
ncbi:MAG: hypothetical protein P4L93_08500 [Coriobacteriia bacterium]|nr:hypothetical protein [Coriobacteriia bacterium]